MKIQLLQENLYKAVSLTSRFTAVQSQLPVLSHIGMQAEEQQLFLMATDMQMGIRLRVAAKILESGTLAVPGKIFTELVKSLPVGMVELKVNEESALEVYAGKAKARLQGMSMQDYPNVGVIEGEEWQKIEVEQLQLLSDKLGFSLSTDDSRPILTGIYWELATGRVVSTDGFRLSLMEGVMRPVTDEGEIKALVLNGRFFQEAVKVLSELGEKQVCLHYDGLRRQLFLQGEEVSLMGRLLQGEYPRFEAIIPKQIRAVVQFDREAMLWAARSAAIFARDNAHILELSLEGNQLVVQARMAQVGENRCVVDVENEKQVEAKVAFNSRYLLDALSQLKAERMIMSLQGDLEAVLFEEVGNETFKHVIMPMKVNQ